MYLEVYPDVVFLINFSVDIILIYLVKKVNKKNSSKLRIILSATVGGISTAILSIFPWMNFILKFMLIYVATSLLMIYIAFGRLRLLDLLKQWIVLNGITYFVGGFINSMYYHTNLRIFLINTGNIIISNISVMHVMVSIGATTVLMVTILWILRLYQVHRPLLYDVELIMGDRHVHVKGLMDTGNCLYDPISGKPVMVVEDTLMEELLTPKIKKDMEAAKDYLNGKSDDMAIPQYDVLRFRFIPYRSIGKTGMMLGIKLDKVMIHAENESICNEKVTVAICDNPLTGGKVDYRVILHKELL